MKASVCVLLALTCCFVAQAEESPMKLTLSKVMNELGRIQKGMKDVTALMIHSPTVNELKDCCVASALECFRSQVMLLSVPDKLKKLQKTVSNELRKSIVVNNLSSCKTEEIESAKCESCNAYRKVNGQNFAKNFQTLLQKIYASQS